MSISQHQDSHRAPSPQSTASERPAEERLTASPSHGLARPLLIAAITFGFCVRLALMPAAAYGDLHAIAYALHSLAFKGVTAVYSEIRELPEELWPVHSTPADFFPYPPLTYYTLGGAMWLLRPLYGEEFPDAVVRPYGQFVETRPQIAWWLFLYKLPLLLVDMGTAAVLWAIGTNSFQRLQLAALWALNPISIIATYLYGQFDILPAFFVALAWLAVIRGRLSTAAAAIGISAAFKVYSIVLIPVFAVVAARSLRGRLRLGAIAFGVFTATLLPLLSDPIGLSVVFGSGWIQQAAVSGVTVGQRFEHTGVLSLFPLAYAFLFLYGERRAAGRPAMVLPYSVSILLLAYCFTFGHLQWFTSIAVLLTIDWVQRPANRPAQLLLYAGAILVSFSWQVGGFFDFFRPVMAGIEVGKPSLLDILPEPIGGAVIAVARSALAGAALFWAYSNVLRPEPPNPLSMEGGGQGDGRTSYRC